MKYCIVILVLFTLVSCKTEYKSAAVKSSYESVMKIHDDVMPEMSTINKLRRKIKKVSDDSNVKTELIKQLENANDGMMQWMSDFDFDENASETAQLEYLADQKIIIQRVSDDMKGSISSAQDYLKE